MYPVDLVCVLESVQEQEVKTTKIESTINIKV